jgi:adenylate cyclase
MTTVLVVDDQPPNIRLLDAILTPRGYDVRAAASGEEALKVIGRDDIDLVLLDILMPGMDGYEVCRRIRQQAETAYLPVVMVTASGDEQKVKALEAGADDFLTKPINQSELLARVASLARIKQYQDTIKRQASELAAWNRELESRVEVQVSQLERMGRLRRFLSPQLAELIVDSGDESFLDSHRREIVVVFCDLRGFTSFAEASEPEEVMGVLEQYHNALGDLIFRFEGTLERFAGDGMMVFFNDPVPQQDHVERAVRMAIAMREKFADLAARWSKLGFDLGFGVGIATGYATIGRIGYEGRYDYGIVGAAVIVAARLSSAAKADQILLNPRAHAAVEALVDVQDVGELELKGFARPIPTVNVVSSKSESGAAPEGAERMPVTTS